MLTPLLMARSDSEELKIAKKSSWGPLFCDIKLLEVLKPVFLFSADHPTASYQQVQATNNIMFSFEFGQPNPF